MLRGLSSEFQQKLNSITDQIDNQMQEMADLDASIDVVSII